MSTAWGDIFTQIHKGIFMETEGAQPSVFPQIISINLTEGAVGTRVVLQTLDAGATPGFLVIGGLFGQDVSWSDTEVSFTVPQGLNVGDKEILLITAIYTSVAYSSFTVTLDGVSPVGQFFQSLRNKLINCSYIASASNVYMGYEDIDLLGKGDEFFPRYEVLVTKDKMNGYASQRESDFSLRYEIAGYLRRATDDVEMQDLIDIIEFGMETRRLNYSFLDDKQAGNSPCKGFLMLGEFSEVEYHFELFPKVSTFILAMEAQIQISDTEVG